MCKDAVIDLDRFTMERYLSIVVYKTAFYSFYLPVACALILHGFSPSSERPEDKEAFGTTRRICISMGKYFQIQDDFLDCFGDPKVIGKIGTDIQECKCGWLVVKALEKANTTQRQVLQDCYGQSDLAKVAKVKALYRELDLESTFRAFEEESHKEITNMVETATCTIPKEVFTELLKKIYKRSK